jgi:hypothetical protein
MVLVLDLARLFFWMLALAIGVEDFPWDVTETQGSA